MVSLNGENGTYTVCENKPHFCCVLHDNDDNPDNPDNPGLNLTSFEELGPDL